MNPTTRHYQLTASEFDWKISDQKTIKAWGFNNTLPGPVIKAKKGDTVVVTVKNNLTESTVIHWHGVRLEATMDGTDEVQTPIKPGESFEYRFHLPDAGTFWYHAHKNETEQMEKGMYGSLIVEVETDPIFDNERVFMIDDMKLTSQNQFKKHGVVGRWIERHDGREGETLLLNGREGLVIDMHAGQTERWRFTNSASARYFRLHLSGKKFNILATDGGLLTNLKEVSEILLVPGERVDIVAGPFAEGETFAIESLPYNRMTFLKAKRQTFATVKVKDFKESVVSIPETLRDIEPLATQDTAITRKVKLSVGPSLKNGIDFLVNNELHHSDRPVNIGELQVWEVSNTSLMDHPFHLHGFFFQVIDVNGVAPEYLAWKDTVNLPPKSKVKIAWIPDNRPGKWMYHCHILEHHEAGMMGHFEVVDSKKAPIAKTAGHHHHHHHA
jgi:FtsP/CotA-like multicopper oxidase with cupredoxin domain